MPLPLIAIGWAIAVAAGAGGAAGTKGGLDIRRAKKTVAAAEDELERAERQTKRATTSCENRFAELGKTKLQAVDAGLVPFHAAFSRLTNVDFEAEVSADGAPPLDPVQVIAAGNVTMTFVDSLAAAALSGGAGAAAGVGTASAVSAFAAASTGTAISGLSGAAASNAALAWLGGGTLASGGGGVFAGTMVAGGITAAPALLVGGVFLLRKGQKSQAKAETFSADVATAVSTHRMHQTILNAAIRQATTARDLLERLTPLLSHENGWLESVVEREPDWRALTDDERHRIHGIAALAMATSDLVHTAVVDEDGEITAAIAGACARASMVAG